jgi:hypothetical protein
MFRVLYSLLLIPVSSVIIVREINYNINREYGNMSLNFSATKDGPEVLCNFTIFNDIPKGWVII